MRALIADDDPNTQRSLAGVLRDLAGFSHVIEVENGPQALAVAALFVQCGIDGVSPIDLVILDRNMPGGDGISALRLMRQAGVKAPVIIVTAEAGEEARREALEAGADGYLCKPFSGTALAAEVERVLLAKKEATRGGDGHSHRPGEAGS